MQCLDAVLGCRKFHMQELNCYAFTPSPPSMISGSGSDIIHSKQFCVCTAKKTVQVFKHAQTGVVQGDTPLLNGKGKTSLILIGFRAPCKTESLPLNGECCNRDTIFPNQEYPCQSLHWFSFNLPVGAGWDSLILCGGSCWHYWEGGHMKEPL